uniref:Uncharacterized protein n=1 Tax=Rhizophora mucronata TaxID=61149 RepID=A0A2P2ISC2_RHIMU
MVQCIPLYWDNLVEVKWQASQDNLTYLCTCQVLLLFS